MGALKNLFHTSYRHDKLNILSFFYNGLFDISLLDTGHNFFGTQTCSAYTWAGFKNINFDNLVFIPEDQIIKLPFDLVIFHHRSLHQKYIQEYQNALHIPALIIDHEMPIQQHFYHKLNNQYNVDAIGANEKTSKFFNNPLTIPTQTFISEPADKTTEILLCGSFSEQNSQQIQQLQRHIPSLKIVGHNKFLESYTVETYQDYKNLVCSAKIYLDFPRVYTYPHEVHWALSSGAKVISTSSKYDNNITMHPNFFTVASVSDVESKLEQIASGTPDVVPCPQTVNFEDYTANFINPWKNVFQQYSERIFQLT